MHQSKGDSRYRRRRINKSALTTATPADDDDGICFCAKGSFFLCFRSGFGSNGAHIQFCSTDFKRKAPSSTFRLVANEKFKGAGNEGKLKAPDFSISTY
ncbi:hypothetical protein TYRP_005039 [Tyrophagus putrescentiae]|nr:hypothetical protein TYRP_005039 [Tyrophagus putrescentiae]